MGPTWRAASKERADGMVFRGGSCVPGATANSNLSPALPALLAHCALIQYPAMAMSIVGGLLIYGTIISFTMFFQEEQEF